MSVRIRLTKVGKKHQISFRIVAQDAQAKRDGKFLEILGFYNPHKSGGESFAIKEDRLKYWTDKGAKPTQAVTNLLGSQVKKRVNGTIFKAPY